MKHAYLIIAHNEFEVLQKLINTLDDVRNDIYVLIDRKVSLFPKLSCKHSTLYILNDEQRVAIYWGHVSQIKAEFSLFNASLQNGPYQYYHIISGTHLPLKSQNFIHDFYTRRQGMQILQPMESSLYEINMKIKKKHFLLKYFKHQNKNFSRIVQIVWRRFLLLQSVFKLEKNEKGDFIKASNWVSLTHDCVAYLLERKNDILKKYKHTFCGDEFFVPSELTSSPFAEKCFFYPWLIYSNIERDTSKVISPEECKRLLKTEYLYARKFTAAEMNSVNMVLEHLKKD